MKQFCSRSTSLAAMIGCFLSGCAAAPRQTVPTVLATPATAESFDVFQQHETRCRQYAQDQIGSQDQVAQQTDAHHIATATGVGAAAGALIGAAAGHAGRGAAIGAATGLLVGAVKGAHSSAAAAAATQSSYNISYSQCMAANGEHIDPRPPVTVAVYRGVLVPRVMYITPTAYVTPAVAAPSP